MFPGRRRDRRADADADRFTAEAVALVDSLYGAALRLTRNPAAAEDLVQDTYLKAFRSRRRFMPDTNLKAWIFTILHNTWRNRRRDHARARVEFDSTIVERLAETRSSRAAPPMVESVEALLAGSSLDEELRRALDELPDIFREAVWLRDVEMLSYKEIAAALDVPLGTVMSRISRGRKQIHDWLVARDAAFVSHRGERSGV